MRFRKGYILELFPVEREHNQNSRSYLRATPQRQPLHQFIDHVFSVWTCTEAREPSGLSPCLVTHRGSQGVSPVPRGNEFWRWMVSHPDTSQRCGTLTYRTGKTPSGNVTSNSPLLSWTASSRRGGISSTRTDLGSMILGYECMLTPCRANNYHYGESEQWIGEWMETRGNRDQIVYVSLSPDRDIIHS